MSDNTLSPAAAAAEQKRIAEEKEIERVSKLSDDQVLKETGYGKFGPGIVGKPLAERAAELLKGTDHGRFGPAIVDPDYAAKQAAKRAAAQSPDAGESDEDEEELEPTGEIDPANLKDPRNPWSYVTLSGAKVLAQEKQVSYKPGIKRKDLIAALQGAGVVPPAIPEDNDHSSEAE